MATKNDEDKMKRRGLDASNKEKPVSFLQRLKMGNIDDPKSEAYKKFGAGRGRKDRDDADFAAEEARGKTARSQSGKAPATSRPVASKTKPAAKAKPAIVTKEELAKSGLSLRDFLNERRNLTRRDGKAPEKAKTPTSAVSRPTRPGQQTSGAAKSSEDNRPKASGAMIQSMDTDMMRAGSRAAAKQSGANRKAAISSKSAVTAEKPKALAISPGVLKQREADEKKRAERREFGRQRDEKKKAESADRDKMSSGQRSAARGAKIKEFFGMKKGGAVCMASKRADGIAVKGKTRGKVY